MDDMTKDGQREFSAEQVERLTKENMLLRFENSLFRDEVGEAKSNEIELKIKRMSQGNRLE